MVGTWGTWWVRAHPEREGARDRDSRPFMRPRYEGGAHNHETATGYARARMAQLCTHARGQAPAVLGALVWGANQSYGRMARNSTLTVEGGVPDMQLHRS